jgi:hypothetical protein
LFQTENGIGEKNHRIGRSHQCYVPPKKKPPGAKSSFLNNLLGIGLKEAILVYGN